MSASPRLATLAACAATAFTLVAAAPALAEDVPFTSAPDLSFDAQSDPAGLALGDFNSDGRQDLAMSDASRGRVHVRLGNGDGTFSDPGPIIVNRPGTIAVGDFNSDGTEDLVLKSAPNPDDEAVVFYGRGDGRFDLARTLNLPAYPDSLAVADFNGDGRTDLAATGIQLSVRFQGADGKFASGFDTPFGQYARGAVVGDFDGDGNDDVAAVANGTPDRLGILPGKGNGTFGGAKLSGIPNTGGAMATGDFNGDGKEDLAVPIFDEARVSVRLGNGDGTLDDDPPDVPVGASPNAVAVGDFDSDGREDLAVTHSDAGTGGVSIRLGNGDGTFRAGGELAQKAPFVLVIGDLNGDGKEDLTFNGESIVAVRLGSGAAPLSGNLLVNGGFEQGLGARLSSQSPAIPGWTTTGDMTFIRYGASPTLLVPGWLDAPRFGTGGVNYLWGGPSSGPGHVTTATQTADVAGSAEGIDGGRATADLSAYLGGTGPYPSNMSATAEFLGADGSVLGDLRIGPVQHFQRGDVTTMLRRAGSSPVPAGTRQIRVTMTAADNDTISLATADNVKLTMDVRPADVVEDPPPPPPQFGADTKVTVRLVSRKVAARGPVRVRVSNGNDFVVPGTLTGRSTAPTGAGKKPSKLAVRPFSIAAGGRATIKLALGKALRRKLARKGKLSVRLSAAVTDPAGNRRTVSRRVGLRLKSAKRG